MQPQSTTTESINSNSSQKKPIKILMLIDFVNLEMNLHLIPPERFSIADGLRRVIRTISREIGEIASVFVFTPPHSAMLWAEDLWKIGFFTVFCPTVKGKKGEEIDTTDEILIKFAENIISQMPDLTHICIGSGDKDFTPLADKALRKGLKIIIFAGDSISLSFDLRKLADTNPETGEKMIYTFTPVSEDN